MRKPDQEGGVEFRPLAELIRHEPAQQPPFLAFDQLCSGEIEPQQIVKPEPILLPLSAQRDQSSVAPTSLSGRYKLIRIAAATLLLTIGSLAAYTVWQQRSPSVEPQPEQLALPGVEGRAYVVAVVGTVLLQRDSLEPSPLGHGQFLAMADRIRTGDSARVDLALARGGAIVRIGPGSDLLLSELYLGESQEPRSGRSRLILGQGSLLADVGSLSAEGGFEVVTPTAIAGVRGTTFAVEASGESARIELLSGTLAVQPVAVDGRRGEEHRLEAGRSLQSRIGEPLREKSIGQQRIAELNHDLQTLQRERAEIDFELIGEAEQGADILTAEEIEERYDRSLEVIVLQDGRTISGLVVGQRGRQLIIHGIGGKVIVNADEIDEIRFSE